MTATKLPPITIGSHAEDYTEAEGKRFLQRYASPGMPLITVKDQFIVDGMSLVDLGLKFKERFPDASMFSEHNTQVALMTLDSKSTNPIYATIYRGDGRSTDVTKAVVTISLQATVKTVTETLAWLDANYAMGRRATVDWYYLDGKGNVNNLSMHIEEPMPFKPEFYPYINDPRTYFKRYLESRSTILFMSGPPGTGKTSFLRSMIYENSLHAMVAYDHRVLEKDEMFMTFLQPRGADILVLEDSEEFLKKRDLDNHLMSKFLNVSDGLVKPKDKKIIFSTNFREFKEVDDALVRPGRSFGFCEFRALTYKEAIKACEVAGLPVPAKPRDYTLAELFNQDTTSVPRQAAVGF